MNRIGFCGVKGRRGRTFVRAVVTAGAWVAFGISSGSGQSVKLENENIYGFALFDLMEIAPGLDTRPVRWDLIASLGKEYDRFWVKSEGEFATSSGEGGEMEFQALYSRLISAYWEAQFGVRLDVDRDARATRTRSHLVVGLEGLAPYWFELEPAFFVSQDGDVSATLVASYDLFLSQRLILQPRIDVDAAVQEVSDWGVGAGLNGIMLGMRLRYELKREVAPYVGLGWSRLLGETADLARGEGRSFRRTEFVLGLRAWR